MFTSRALVVMLLLLAAGLFPLEGVAQTQPAGDAVPEKPRLKQEELEQILAPIALYPDSLLSQIFMASTYPLEVIQAQRWTAQNKSLKDAALTAELERQSWDPSVKSLVNLSNINSGDVRSYVSLERGLRLVHRRPSNHRHRRDALE